MRYAMPITSGWPVAREESQRFSAADFPEPDFWTGMSSNWRQIINEALEIGFEYCEFSLLQTPL